MAIIACKECGKEVSDAAPVCPNCGVRVNTGAAAGAKKVPFWEKKPTIGQAIGKETKNAADNITRGISNSIVQKINMFISGFIMNLGKKK